MPRSKLEEVEKELQVRYALLLEIELDQIIDTPVFTNMVKN